MMTNEARVAAVMERVRARVQLRKQRRMGRGPGLRRPGRQCGTGVCGYRRLNPC